MNKLLLSIIWLALTLANIPAALAQNNDWPRTLPLEQGTLTIYSPQVDEMLDGVIHFRAALAYRATADDEPVFGAGWFESQVEIDSSNRIVHPLSLKVNETRFPAGTVELQPELSSILSRQSSGWNLDFTLDELETALQTAKAESRAAQNLNTTPPRIIYRDHPALLVSMDGEPVLREIENSSFKAVINTPYPLIFDGKNYYLNAASDIWYRASKATGPYRFEAMPPNEIAVMVSADDPEATEVQATELINAANAPEIIVSTEPAELIVTEGPAAFAPLVDDLLVLQNSDDDVFMHVSSQNFYIVLAGRWYHARSLNGPWAYQRADDLPTAFASIPQDSNQADSRVYVAGTQEARDAVLDAQVPQTAAVSRGEVDIDVAYDGDPDFETVDGTDMVYADNTGSTVILSDGWYYLVENGVWYVSSSASGPWQVSDHRPDRVSSILPTSPVYNVKYVYVYDSTPSVVYVGYTPGYTGSYVYNNTVFYGSGWHYQPWVSAYNYYPRHRTWGAHVVYNPWSGWNFGLSWGWGPFSLSYYTGGYWHNSHYWHHRYYGGWGPRGYRSRHGRHNDRYSHYGSNRRGNDRYTRNGYGRQHDDRRSNDRHSNNRQRSNEYERHDNLYRDRGQRAKVYNSRDNQRGTPGENRDLTRQANYIAASGSKQRNNAAPNKGQHQRIDPVSRSDLRIKAKTRDANQPVQRKSPALSPTRQASYIAASGSKQRNNAAQKKGRNERIEPVSRSDLRIKARTRDANQPVQRTSLALNTRTQTSQTRKDNIRHKQRLSPVSYASAAPAVSGKNRMTNPQRRSGVVSKPARQPQSRKETKKYSQRLSPTTNASALRAPSNKNSTKNRQRLSPATNTRVNHTQATTRNTRSRQQQPPRVNPSPAQKQTSPRAGAVQQRPQVSAQKHSAPTKNKAQKSTGKQRNKSKGSDRRRD